MMMETHIQQAASARHWNEWKRMKEFLLYGSSTRNTIAGMIVIYASAPATLSLNPLAAAGGGGVGRGVAPGVSI
jgi:hypothetical protein